MTGRNHSQGLFGRIGAAWRRFRRDRGANVAVIFALALVPTLGVFGLGSEGSYWLLTHRAEQNAADAAVMAAAQAGQADSALSTLGGAPCSGGTDCYKYEGKAVATNYGFTQGANNVTGVEVLNGQTCPATATASGSVGATRSYYVIITNKVPLYFVNAVGYRGTNGSGLQTIQAVAWAGPTNESVPVCVLALGPDAGGKSATLLQGAPDSNLGDSAIFSDATSTYHNG